VIATLLRAVSEMQRVLLALARMLVRKRTLYAAQFETP
jgi:hypothetical protein